MSNATLTAQMAATMTKVAGVPVEVTFRGATSFTFSTAEVNNVAAFKLREFFSADPRATVTVENDAECGTFVYVDISA